MIGLDTTFLVHLTVPECREHQGALSIWEEELHQPGIPFALTPQVIAEYIHVVTDPRRFQQPLDVRAACQQTQNWWNASQIHPISLTPQTMDLFHQWMSRYNLGRKKILDTLIAASYHQAGVRQILTSNTEDFERFNVFHCIRYYNTKS